MPIRVDPPNDEWADLFEVERAVLEPALAPWSTTPLEHIGSTSITGLAAKPIIDMLVGVSDLVAARDAVPPLARLGYAHAEHRTDALYFLRSRRAYVETHHLHLTEVGSRLWLERLAFRDALRADPDLVRRYQRLKTDLAAQHDDVRVYTAGKRAFVADVLAGAGITLEARP